MYATQTDIDSKAFSRGSTDRFARLGAANSGAQANPNRLGSGVPIRIFMLDASASQSMGSRLASNGNGQSMARRNKRPLALLKR